MSNFTQKVEKLTLPVIALGGVTAFPAIPLNFEISDPSSLAAANAANATDSFVLLLSLKAPVDGELCAEHFYRTGTVAKIKQCVRSSKTEARVLCEGYARAQLLRFHRFADYYTAEVICRTVAPTEPDLPVQALLREDFEWPGGMLDSELRALAVQTLCRREKEGGAVYPDAEASLKNFRQRYGQLFDTGDNVVPMPSGA